MINFRKFVRENEHAMNTLQTQEINLFSELCKCVGDYEFKFQPCLCAYYGDEPCDVIFTKVMVSDGKFPHVYGYQRDDFTQKEKSFCVGEIAIGDNLSYLFPELLNKYEGIEE